MGSGNEWQRQHEERRAARDSAAAAKAAKLGRDGGPFIVFLKVVQQSEGWRRAPHPARSLLLDMLFSVKNLQAENGRLIATATYLRECGWTSNSTISAALKDLIECGLLIETRKGARPNVPAFFAVTWQKIDRSITGLDIDPAKFKTGAYLTPNKPALRASRSRTAAATKARKVASKLQHAGYTTTPSHGALGPIRCTVRRGIASFAAPSDGAIEAPFDPSSTPSDGDHLDLHHLGVTAASADSPPSDAAVASAKLLAVRKMVAPQSRTPSPSTPALPSPAMSGEALPSEAAKPGVPS